MSVCHLSVNQNGVLIILEFRHPEKNITMQYIICEEASVSMSGCAGYFWGILERHITDPAGSASGPFTYQSLSALMLYIVQLHDI